MAISAAISSGSSLRSASRENEAPSLSSASQLRTRVVYSASPPRSLPSNTHRRLAISCHTTSHNQQTHMNSRNTHEASGGVPVFVMLPLDTVSRDGKLNRRRALAASLAALRAAGIRGVMLDVWWGIVERAGPGTYDWQAYAELAKIVRDNGLQLQAVMSFHQCGGNVGDNCTIPLPGWVLEEVAKDPDLVYTDRNGRRNNEYVSLGCDELPVLKGRTPVQVYRDYMVGFRDRFQEYLGDTIVEIQVGLGPCGELRYPSYPESNGTWKFPGIGEFQCYDKYMLSSLQSAAAAAGHPEWGHGGPHDAGHYSHQSPEDTNFFRRDGSWNSEYGHFFLSWYSTLLLSHGDRILTAAGAAFDATGVRLSAKVAGIHWHYRTRSHAAELTAGYYNTRHHDGYVPIAELLGRHGAALNFTCMEMRDREQPDHACCSPEGLVRQVAAAADRVGVELAGENALERYDEWAYDQVVRAAKGAPGGMGAFTYLRMNGRLFDGDNWRKFVEFVKRMREGGGSKRYLRSPCDAIASSGLTTGEFMRNKSAKGEEVAA